MRDIADFSTEEGPDLAFIVHCPSRRDRPAVMAVDVTLGTSARLLPGRDPSSGWPFLGRGRTGAADDLADAVEPAPDRAGTSWRSAGAVDVSCAPRQAMRPPESSPTEHVLSCCRTGHRVPLSRSDPLVAGDPRPHLLQAMTRRGPNSGGIPVAVHPCSGRRCRPFLSTVTRASDVAAVITALPPQAVPARFAGVSGGTSR